jgi:hypothetical protein
MGNNVQSRAVCNDHKASFDRTDETMLSTKGVSENVAGEYTMRLEV